MVVTKEMADFALEYLQSNNGEKENLTICILNGYDCIQGPDGTVGFAVYSTEEHIIYIAGELPGEEEEVFSTIAHEYKHYEQQMKRKKYSELWAEMFAMRMRKRMVKAWNLRGKYD